MTPLEREEMRKLVKLRNQKREETAQGKTGEIWVIRGGRVVNVARRLRGSEGEEVNRKGVEEE
jgi:hypothetical protein